MSTSEGRFVLLIIIMSSCRTPFFIFLSCCYDSFPWPGLCALVLFFKILYSNLVSPFFYISVCLVSLHVPSCVRPPPPPKGSEASLGNSLNTSQEELRPAGISLTPKGTRGAPLTSTCASSYPQPLTLMSPRLHRHRLTTSGTFTMSSAEPSAAHTYINIIVFPFCITMPGRSGPCI